MNMIASVLLTLCATATVVAQIPRVPVPRDLPLPRIDRWTRGEPPLTTSLKDARVAIKTYATTQDVPLIPFERGQRKDDIVAGYRARRPMDDGVVVIGVAQEKMRAFKALNDRARRAGSRLTSPASRSPSITITSTCRIRSGGPPS